MVGNKMHTDSFETEMDKMISKMSWYENKIKSLAAFF